MKKEDLVTAIALQNEVNNWESKVNMINEPCDRMSLSMDTGSIHGCYQLCGAEKELVVCALSTYFKQQLKAAQRDFENFKPE